MWIYVKDYGRMFIWAILKGYLGGNPILFAFLILYLFLVIAIAVKGTKQERAWFLWPNVIWLLTVFNPLVAIPLIQLFNMDLRYYRYFWLLPLPILFGYAVVKLMERCNKVGKVAVVTGIALLCILGRSYMQPYLGMPGNVYKTDRNIVKMSAYIQQDSEKEEKCVLYDSLFLFAVRSYDASIFPYVPRRELEQVNGEMTAEAVEAAVANRDFHNLIKYEYFGGYDFPVELMEEALQTENIDYIILKKDKSVQYQNFISYGCVEVADSNDYWLLRCP